MTTQAADTAAKANLEHVWQPLEIGPVQVRHRVMHTATSILYGENGCIGPRHVAYYRERAKGGTALLITEQQHASPVSTAFPQDCSALKPEAVDAYAKLAEAVHAEGAAIFAQLTSCGAQGNSMMHIDTWEALKAPSAVPSVINNQVPAVMDQSDIAATIEQFVRSAVNCAEGGLDGVELSAAHHWLLGQFVSPSFNKRDDEYGGDAAGRARILLEIGERVRERLGTSIALGVRMSFNDYIPGGVTPEVSEETIAILAEPGYFDFFNISGGGHDSLHMAVATMSAPFGHGYLVPYARTAKRIVGERAKVFVTGRIHALELADELVGEGATDMVAMTRAQMADPFLVAKYRSGRAREVIRCSNINQCNSRAFYGSEVVCAANPVTGRERQWGDGTLQPVARGEAKRVVVVGAGPAGMHAAAVAARRGHEVTLLERASEVGGHLTTLAKIPSREDTALHIDNLRREVENAEVDLRLGVPLQADALEALGPEVVICATGSTWDTSGFSMFRPEREGIPGSGQPHVIGLGEAIERAAADPAGLGEHVLILDQSSDYPPLGLADMLSAVGAAVRVISPEMFVGKQTLVSLDMPWIYPKLKERGVELIAQSFLERIGEDTVEIYDLFNPDPRTVRADTVVMAVSKRVERTVFDQLPDGGADAHLIGDALAPRGLTVAMYDGERTGRAV